MKPRVLDAHFLFFGAYLLGAGSLGRGVTLTALPRGQQAVSMARSWVVHTAWPCRGGRTGVDKAAFGGPCPLPQSPQILLLSFGKYPPSKVDQVSLHFFLVWETCLSLSGQQG